MARSGQVGTPPRPRTQRSHPSPSLGPPLLSPSWSPPLFCGMEQTVVGGAVAGGAVAGGAVAGGAVVGVVAVRGVVTIVGEVAVVGVVAVRGVVTIVGEVFARVAVVLGELAPEEQHAARSRPPATRIASDRTSRFIGVLPLIPGETLCRRCSACLTSDYRDGDQFVHQNQGIPEIIGCPRSTSLGDSR